MDIADDGAEILKVLCITGVIKAKQIVAEGFSFNISGRPSKNNDVRTRRWITGIEKRTMRLGGEIAANAMETLERSSCRSRDVFAKSTHGKDEINASNVAKI